MYLAISAVAAMCAFLAAVQTRNAKRLGTDLREKTIEAESFQLTARTMENRLRAEEAVRAQLADHITKVETALRESEDTACRLRQELQTERRKYKELQGELDLAKDAHDAAISAMWSARNEVDNLKQENGKLTEALNTERESAEHWREEHQKEQLWRMSTEGHILRELHNILNYDGSAHGQEELEE